MHNGTSKRRHCTTKVHASAIAAYGVVTTLTFTLKTLSAMLVHMADICDKFHWYTGYSKDNVKIHMGYPPLPSLPLPSISSPPLSCTPFP